MKKYHEYKELLSSGGFNLRKFLCNSESIPQSGEQKVLGVKWDLSGDELVVDLREAVHDVQETEVLTKRRIVSIVSRIFDPIGIASPVTIQAKLLLQQLHKAKIEWDSSIEGELLMRCWSILHLLRESQPLRVPRWYERDWEECDNASLRLYGFSDASTKAYAAVVYLVRCFDGEKRSVLIASKSRVAPTSQLTVPRLELMGALLLARLIDSIRKALELDDELLPSLCYSDSQVALFWIRGENKEWKPFAQNRVRTIKSLVPANNWKFCPGKDNPADLPSQGASVSELLTKSIWFQGPEWIGTELIENISSEMPTECMQELRASDRTCSLLVSDKSLKQVIDLKRYS